jgi:hypothetical protein
MDLGSMGKKGFLLTLLALVIGTFFIVIFSARINNPPDYKTEMTEGRLSVLNYYADSFFNYAESATVLSGYSGLQGLIKDMYSNKAYSSGFYSDYTSCVEFGNLSPILPCPGMSGKYLSFYLKNLTISANSELKMNSNFTINSIAVIQTEDPFYLQLVLNITLSISDPLANITTTRSFTGFVPIDGLPDPIYLLNGTYNRTIKKGDITKKEGTWNPIDLEQMYNAEEYRFTSRGISFLNRMMGNFTNNSMGIESIVNYTDPRVISLITENRSFVDYLFWSRAEFDCTSMNVVYINNISLPSMPPGLQLDDEHRVLFNITNVNAYPTC